MPLSTVRAPDAYMHSGRAPCELITAGHAEGCASPARHRTLTPRHLEGLPQLVTDRAGYAPVAVSAALAVVEDAAVGLQLQSCHAGGIHGRPSACVSYRWACLRQA